MVVRYRFLLLQIRDEFVFFDWTAAIVHRSTVLNVSANVTLQWLYRRVETFLSQMPKHALAALFLPTILELVFPLFFRGA